MGLYSKHLLPRLQDIVMNRPTARDARGRVCDGLRGEVVEFGFGTGLNVAHYPRDVVTVHAVEPSALCMRIARPRIGRSSAAVELAGLTGEHVDLPSAEFDAGLSTWTLCTIPDVEAALSEMRRVLKPGASLHFVEHGRAPDAEVRRWQRRLEPMNKRVAGGCHLTRDIPALIEQAGFALEALDAHYVHGEPKPFGYTFEGRARKV